MSLTNRTPTLSERDLDRFWQKVGRECTPDECWLWKGKPNAEGRGRFTAQGLTDYAYRWSLFIHGCRFGPDDEVNHICCNPGCVRPSHLEVVDHANNMAHMARCGRHGHARLSVRDVTEIRREWAAPDRPRQREIAERHGVHRTTVTKVLSRSTWNAIDEPTRKGGEDGNPPHSTGDSPRRASGPPRSRRGEEDGPESR